MPDEKQNQDPGQQSEPPVYASPVKRAWAWVGIAYMLITLATFTYYLATARILTGIGPLLFCPALAGLGAHRRTALSRRRRAGRTRWPAPF